MGIGFVEHRQHALRQLIQLGVAGRQPFTSVTVMAKLKGPAPPPIPETSWFIPKRREKSQKLGRPLAESRLRARLISVT